MKTKIYIQISLITILAIYYLHPAKSHYDDQNQNHQIGQIVTINNKNYKLKRNLGIGFQATVFSATDLEENKLVAIKIFKIPSKKESIILKKLNCCE